MKKTAIKAGLAAVLALSACGVQARTDGQQAVSEVGERLRAGDCPGARDRLNAGLGAGYPEIALLAGGLFETGTCVQADWNRSVHFYALAADGGIREAGLRLAAGYAAATNGPDMAAAMWWARRARLQADSCTANLPKTDDPDRFVDELRKWPGQELAACNYVVGMISFIQAESRYPMLGVTREAAGRVEAEYVPGESRLRVDMPDATEPARRGAGEVITRAQSIAGARYKKPRGIDPAWHVPFVFAVDTDKSRWW